MPVLTAVAYFAFFVHFCSAAAVEDEHSDSELVVCLAAVAAKVVWLDYELVPEGLLASVADSYCLGFIIAGNL
ncbi:hypothetical protein AAC387_Pa03g1472 [Persea americana]